MGHFPPKDTVIKYVCNVEMDAPVKFSELQEQAKLKMDKDSKIFRYGDKKKEVFSNYIKKPEGTLVYRLMVSCDASLTLWGRIEIFLSNLFRKTELIDVSGSALDRYEHIEDETLREMREIGVNRELLGSRKPMA